MKTSSVVSRAVELQVLTWIRDSNGLFDYEDLRLIKQTFSLRSSAQILRIRDLCVVMEEGGEQLEDSQLMGSITMQADGSETLFQCGESDSCVWQVVRAMSNCQLSEGDLFKIGTTAIEVRQISLYGYDEPRLTDCPIPSCTFDREQVDKLPCRICLSDIHSKSDPLISPCSCAGTMRYIHVNCLKAWLENKVTPKSEGRSTVYSWSLPYCELCKSQLPLAISIDGTIMNLVKIVQPSRPFIVVQIEPQTTHMKVQVLSMIDGNSLLIGRASNCDIRIEAASASRKHAEIKFSEGAFILTDRKSKYGTLIRKKNPIRLTSGYKKAVQVGRTVLIMKIKVAINWKSFFSCCRTTRVHPEPVYKEEVNSVEEDLSQDNLIRRLNERAVNVARDSVLQ